MKGEQNLALAQSIKNVCGDILASRVRDVKGRRIWSSRGSKLIPRDSLWGLRGYPRMVVTSLRKLGILEKSMAVLTPQTEKYIPAKWFKTPRTGRQAGVWVYTVQDEAKLRAFAESPPATDMSEWYLLMAGKLPSSFATKPREVTLEEALERIRRAIRASPDPSRFLLRLLRWLLK